VNRILGPLDALVSVHVTNMWCEPTHQLAHNCPASWLQALYAGTGQASTGDYHS
jgi:hypothetical protein